MNGILIIDKPEGLTSHDVVACLRRILKTKKIGHTGTLDPFATGVLVMLVGKATRLAAYLDKDEKEYDALVKFGYATDTGDRTGTRLEREGYEPKQITPDDLIRTISGFMGEIKQVPPMYSAKKVDGRRLYELAREGKEIERAPVPVTIFKLQLNQDRLPQEAEAGTFYLRFQVTCSAGTYIRTLAEDIGRELGPMAHLEELRRVRAGQFGLDRALTLEELEAQADPYSSLIPMSEAVAHLPSITLPVERVEKTLNGMSTRFSADGLNEGQNLRMLNEAGELIAIGTYNAEEESIQPKVVLG
ncbi:MAG: tRNA pseudouridine(55) synthase TruB [Pyrinomonadaceae bacterium]|nr:tRNA pseudouridine(55) synthase TruB [Pyrinomonadaceae bacterium]